MRLLGCFSGYFGPVSGGVQSGFAEPLMTVFGFFSCSFGVTMLQCLAWFRHIFLWASVVFLGTVFWIFWVCWDLSEEDNGVVGKRGTYEGKL